MKNLLVLSAALFSVNSFAVTVKAPLVSFPAGEATTFVSVQEVCNAGEEFKTINEKEIYAHVRQGKNDELVVVGKDILSRPRTYVTTISTGHDGRNEQEITVTLPLKYTIEYWSDSHGDHYGRVLYTKEFTLPACN